MSEVDEKIAQAVKAMADKEGKILLDIDQVLSSDELSMLSEAA